MTTLDRDEARADLVQYLKAMAANWNEARAEIEEKYQLAGHDPLIVSIGLEAAAAGKDPQAAVSEYLDEEQ